jgi:hypothetical protein
MKGYRVNTQTLNVQRWAFNVPNRYRARRRARCRFDHGSNGTPRATGRIDNEYDDEHDND